MIKIRWSADDGTWQRREETRLADGTYKQLPWRLKPIADHYVHFARAAGLIAYTKDEKNGGRDIQTPIKPGKYLKTFYPKLTEQRVRTLCAQIDTFRYGLKFAETPVEIVKVYRVGPQSCMKDRKSVCVYGRGDLAVAYLVEDKRIVARAVVWPKKKVFHRSYGDINRIDERLRSLGYKKKEGWCFEGAKIGRIPLGRADPKNIHMPSIDGHGNYDIIEDDPKHLVIRKNGIQYGNILNLPVACANCSEMGYAANYYSRRGKTRVIVPIGNDEKWCTQCIDKGIAAKTIVKCYYGDYCKAKDVTKVMLKVELDIYSAFPQYKQAEHDCSKAWAKHNAFRCAGTGKLYCRHDFRYVTLANGKPCEWNYFSLHGYSSNFKNYLRAVVEA